MSRYKLYNTALSNDAEDFVNQYFDTFLENIKDMGSQNFDSYVNDDGKLHETIDQYLDLEDAVTIIENCSEEETDSGLWEGLSPKEAIVSMAFWSYKNDMYFRIKELFEERINEVINEELNKLEHLETRLGELEELFEGLDEDDNRIESVDDKITDLRDKIDNINEYIGELNDSIDHD